MWIRNTLLVPCLNTLKAPNRFPWIPFSLSHYSDIPIKKPKVAPLQERKMVDRFRLWAKGGDGGNGCCSFRRSRNDPRGKPDGGNGGRGGDVILECSVAVWDLSNLQHHLNASRGGHGVSKNKIGKRGTDKVMQVPVGTVVHLVQGEVPSFVESRSTTNLNPWDMPGNPSKPDQHFYTNSHSVVEETSNLLEKQDLGNSYHYENRNMNKSSEKRNMDKSSCMLSKIPSSPVTISKSSRFNELKARTSTEDSILSSEEDDDDDEEMGSEEDQSDYEDMGSDGFPEMEVEEEEVIQHSVAEFTEPGQRLVIARAGEGGLGNASWGKASKSHNYVKSRATVLDVDIQDSEDHSSLNGGSRGSESILILELKSIADVGLVGMPNAGKSTLLGAISRAKPVVGDYAFTTLRPNIGNLNYDDFFSVTVADIPGLIKGAHENRGLGHAFLRHIERTKVLAYVVDLASALDGRNGIHPWEQLRDLVLELEYYQEGLSVRPSLVVANKIDEEGTSEVYEELKRRVQGVPIYPVCAVLEEGITELKAGLRRLVDGTESWRLDLDGINID
ncbi:putative GTP-binding protein OBGM, mitochondrial [Cinnamomum micranthum f. kanehirae]|uniref:Putative GTP-binding protein OBGM, mitochondrial n=1 Tax=Cinnamomum micranthum f. kanehirae TaxID=337451 RepID=A0A3S3P549_9MAGN|nr:putative GTP-binding protein OBGM, mitochondrial [Cinnamomum micranthum f. kanehirae]